MKLVWHNFSLNRLNELKTLIKKQVELKDKKTKDVDSKSRAVHILINFYSRSFFHKKQKLICIRNIVECL